MSKARPKKQEAPAANTTVPPALYSRHILFFPFQWRAGDRPAPGATGFERLRSAVGSAGHWKSALVNRQTDYSGYHYLHEYAASAVFEQPGENTGVLNYAWNGDTAGGMPFLVGIRNAAIIKNGMVPEALGLEPANDQDSLLRLKCFLARLNLYETGVGVLSLLIDNFQHRDKNAVLLINDFARRMYPPYLHFKSGKEAVKDNGALPAFVQLGDWKEEWKAFPSVGQSPAPGRFLPEHILGLLGPGFSVEAEKGKITVEQILDDRMFVMSLLLDEGEAARLSDLSGDSEYLNDDFWYAYTFLDPGKPQIASRAMMENLLREATYARWTGDATFYGACRYAFAALSKHAWLKTPMTHNYARLTELCLVQRASALRFREEASAISAQIAGNRNAATVARQIRDLYGAYIRFVNRFHFPEATPVEQGIELYDLLRKQLRVQEQADRLKDELEELQSYAAMLHEEERGRALNFLTVLGAAFLLPSFLVSYFSLSDHWKRPLEAHPIATGVVFSMSFGLALLLYYGRFFQTRNVRLWIAGIALTVLYLSLLYALPHLAEWGLLL